MPSVTLPCFFSMFHSQPPQMHGVTSNNWTPAAQRVLGLFDVARNAKLRCGFFHNWEPLRNLNLPGALDMSYFRDNVRDFAGGDHLIAREAMRYLQSDAPDFLFVYFGTTDIAGHDFGWMSAEYLAQLTLIDGLVGTLLAALPQGTTALITSDHGGHERNHGMDIPEDMTTPLFLLGPSVRAGHEIIGPVSILDVAPTLARLLGIEAPAEWQGRCLDEAFVA